MVSICPVFHLKYAQSLDGCHRSRSSVRMKGTPGMKKLVWLIGVSILLCLGHGVVAQTSSIEGFEVGQRWQYDHEGPRPGAMEPNAIDGQRILQVVSETAQDGQTVWIIEERFTQDPNGVGLMSVDDKGLLRSLEVMNAKGESMRLTYESAIAYQTMAMDVGEQKLVETRLLTGDGKFKIPIRMAVKRLEDETLVTAAGEFQACRHLEFVTTSVIDLKLVKIPMQETRHRWYSDQVHGLIKEVYQKAPGKFMTWSWEGYTSTSTLASFGVADVDVNTVQAMGLGAERPGHPPDRGSNRLPHFLKWMGIFGVLFAGACVVVVRVVRRRR
jgi:hypothetical protein